MREGRRLDDQHSHHRSMQTLSSAGEEKRRKRKGRRKSIGRNERRKTSRSSSLSGRSRHSSDDTSTGRRLRSRDRERGRMEQTVSSSPGGKRQRKGLLKNHSVDDLRDLQHINGSLHRSLNHGYRRSNTSPDLMRQRTKNRTAMVEPPALQSPHNFDWADQVRTKRPPRSIISHMEDDERLVALERLNSDIMVRVNMLELKHENSMLKTRIERMEEGGIAVRKHRESPIVSSNEEPEHVNYKCKTTTKRLPRSTLTEHSSGLTNILAEENSWFYFHNKRNKSIVVGLLLAAVGGITGIILSGSSSKDAVYQPLTDDAPIFESTIFPVWTKDEGI